MMNAEGNTLVLKGPAGEYYLLPQETLEQGRVPEERRAEVERLLAEGTQGGSGEDVQGFSYARLWAVIGSVRIGTRVTTDTGRLDPGLHR